MKVLMMRPSYRPELSGGTHLAIDLVEDFIAAGIAVEVVTPISEKYKRIVDDTTDECIVHRITSKYESRGTLFRILRYIDVSRQMYKMAIKLDADVVMTHSMPPLLGPIGAQIEKKKKVPVLYWEQDIVSESLISTGVFGKSGFKQKLMYKVAQSLEKRSERGSTHIVTISEQFKRMHTDRGIPDNKVTVVYNWIDTDQVYPVPREDNPLFDELGIPRNKFIVSYCGNLGIPQNVEIMIDAAEKLQSIEDLLFVILGGGSREDYIKQYILKKKLKNLMLFPLQPLEQSHFVYSIGDVGLVIGRKGTSKNGFPSKTWSIMAAERPMIACFDVDSELCHFVEDGECGLVVEPDSSQALGNAIMNLFTHRELATKMGQNARVYVESRFGRSGATAKIIKEIERAVTEYHKA